MSTNFYQTISFLHAVYLSWRVYVQCRLKLLMVFKMLLQNNILSYGKIIPPFQFLFLPLFEASLCLVAFLTFSPVAVSEDFHYSVLLWQPPKSLLWASSSIMPCAIYMVLSIKAEEKKKNTTQNNEEINPRNSARDFSWCGVLSPHMYSAKLVLK